jgi:hypothetical protein
MSRPIRLPRLKPRNVVTTGVAGGVGGEIVTWLVEGIPQEHDAWKQAR